MNDRIFFAKPEYAPMSGDGSFLGITEGERGYSVTTVYDQDYADVLNERQDITEAMVEAAVQCSMFNNWNTFDKLVKMYENAS